MDEDEKARRLQWLAENQPELRAALRERGRWIWLASTMKTIATWVAVIMGGVMALKSALGDFTGVHK